MFSTMNSCYSVQIWCSKEGDYYDYFHVFHEAYIWSSEPSKMLCSSFNTSARGSANTIPLLLHHCGAPYWAKHSPFPSNCRSHRRLHSYFTLTPIFTETDPLFCRSISRQGVFFQCDSHAKSVLPSSSLLSNALLWKHGRRRRSTSQHFLTASITFHGSL